MKKEKKKFPRVVPTEVSVTELNPLNIKCTTTKCEDGLHCFRPSKRALKEFGQVGCCQECGAVLIEWERIYQNNVADAPFIFNSMKNELIRHVFWHTEIEDKAISNALKRGKNDLKVHARKKLKSKIGKIPNDWDGRQTPMISNDIVTYAQHATATCCRKCLQYWHNIDYRRQLTEQELDFCTELVMLYIQDRVCSLQEEKLQKFLSN